MPSNTNSLKKSSSSYSLLWFPFVSDWSVLFVFYLKIFLNLILQNSVISTFQKCLKLIKKWDYHEGIVSLTILIS